MFLFNISNKKNFLLYFIIKVNIQFFILVNYIIKIIFYYLLL